MSLLKKQRQKVVENVEVYSEHVWLRVVIVVVLILIGFGSLSYGLVSCLNRNNGWHEIELSTDCYEFAPEFSLNYNLGQSGVTANMEYNHLSELYSEIALKAYKIFDPYEEYKGIGNLASLSANINSEVSVDPLLYDAIKITLDKGERHLFLAPLYIKNIEVCESIEDDEASINDPRADEIAAEYFSDVMKFVSSEAHIKLELKGNGKVVLSVSDDYKEFVDENGIDALVDFHWLRNAFMVDAIADRLVAEGYTFGNVSSYNGFRRNLDKSGQSYDAGLFTLVDKVRYPAATLRLSDFSSVVNFRSFPLTSVYACDDYTYYAYKDGRIVSPYLSYTDGLDRCAVPTLTGVSSEKSCAEIALDVFRYYSADSLDVDKINALKTDGIKSVWVEGETVYYNDDTLKPVELYSDEDCKFRSEKIK